MDASHLAAQVCVHLKLVGRPRLVRVRAGASLRQLLLPARPHSCTLAAALRDASASFKALNTRGAGVRVVVGLHVCGGGQDAEQEGALAQGVTGSSQVCMLGGWALRASHRVSIKECVADAVVADDPVHLVAPQAVQQVTARTTVCTSVPAAKCSSSTTPPGRTSTPWQCRRCRPP
jgi:hypothetical protein